LDLEPEVDSERHPHLNFILGFECIVVQERACVRYGIFHQHLVDNVFPLRAKELAGEQLQPLLIRLIAPASTIA